MEEEFGNALTMNEDLQVQFEQMLKVRCRRCLVQPRFNVSTQLEKHLYQLQINHRPSVIVEDPGESSMVSSQLNVNEPR